MAAGGQVPSRRTAHGAVIGHPELGAVSAGLLEVVAEDFVELDETGFMLIQPGGIALVEVCAHRFRQRLVGGVAE